MQCIENRCECDCDNCYDCNFTTHDCYQKCKSEDCEECDGNGHCVVCNNDPTKCCVNGECKSRCELKNGNVCASMNSNCGCCSADLLTCGDHLKMWTAGVDKICDSDCGSPEGCDTCAEMIICYWWLLCKAGPSSSFSICTGSGYCDTWIWGTCITCVPRYDIPAQPQYICNQACE